MLYENEFGFPSFGSVEGLDEPQRFCSAYPPVASEYLKDYDNGGPTIKYNAIAYAPNTAEVRELMGVFLDNFNASSSFDAYNLTVVAYDTEAELADIYRSTTYSYLFGVLCWVYIPGSGGSGCHWLTFSFWCCCWEFSHIKGVLFYDDNAGQKGNLGLASAKASKVRAIYFPAARHSQPALNTPPDYTPSPHSSACITHCAFPRTCPNSMAGKLAGTTPNSSHRHVQEPVRDPYSQRRPSHLIHVLSQHGSSLYLSLPPLLPPLPSPFPSPGSAPGAEPLRVALARGVCVHADHDGQVYRQVGRRRQQRSRVYPGLSQASLLMLLKTKKKKTSSHFIAPTLHSAQRNTRFPNSRKTTSSLASAPSGPCFSFCRIFTRR